MPRGRAARKRRLLGNVGRAHSLFEHGHERSLNLGRRRCRVEKAGRSAITQAGGICVVCDIGVGVAVFVIPDRAGVLDRLIRNIEDRDGDAAVLDGGAIIGAGDAVRRNDGRRILIRDGSC